MSRRSHDNGFVPVARLGDLAPGTGKVVQLGDRLVALFNVDGAVYATDNSCPHSGGPLGKGTLAGEIVTCPWHMWSFNVRTGVCEINPEERIETYPVRLRNGQILIKLPA
jgi:NAD(P)H-dependent nitrite reductase small subunit